MEESQLDSASCQLVKHGEHRDDLALVRDAKVLDRSGCYPDASFRRADRPDHRRVKSTPAEQLHLHSAGGRNETLSHGSPAPSAPSGDAACPSGEAGISTSSSNSLRFQAINDSRSGSSTNTSCT